MILGRRPLQKLLAAAFPQAQRGDQGKERDEDFVGSDWEHMGEGDDERGEEIGKGNSLMPNMMDIGNTDTVYSLVMPVATLFALAVFRVTGRMESRSMSRSVSTQR